MNKSDGLDQSAGNSSMRLWLMLLVMSFLLTACGGGGSSSSRDPILGGDITADIAPTVAAVDPLPNALGVPVNTRLITAAFSKAMDATSLSPANFTLACPAGAAQSGTVSYTPSGNVATLALAANLPANTTCTATIGTGVKDERGNALASPFVWTFSTGAAPDATPPTVTSTFPAAGAVGVAVNTLITASFSEAMDPLSMTSATVRLSCGAGNTSISGSVGYAVNGNVATLTPASALPPSTACTATLSTGVKDLAGNAMANPFTWTFTTGVLADTAPPTVSTVFPANQATGVPFGTLITASFSEAMNPLTISSASIKLACPAGVVVTGTVGYAAVGNVATLTPASPLPANTTCSATITTDVKDVAGNALATPFVWTFTTGAVPNNAPPFVVSTFPASNATGVAFNTLISAIFSEAMDPLSINAATLQLACPLGTPVSGPVGYSVNGNAAVLTPSSPLPANTTCTATLSTGVRNVTGLAMSTPFTWTFTTGAAPDTTAPIVSSIFPTANATGVAFNTVISASFSEPMDPLLITTAHVTLACPAGTPVAGTVGYVVIGNAAVFTPTSALPANTTCTATLAAGVRDVAGNTLRNPFVWTFNTGPVPDTTAPTVVSTLPAANASGIALNTLITASFSEAMNPLTLTVASVRLACPSGSAISGPVGYAVNGNVVTLTPSSNLPASTVCTATITTDAKDVAGNPLASTFTWMFTTGVAPDTTAPSVSGVSPLSNASNVTFNSRIIASFSEAMDPLTVNAASFTLACPVGTAISGTVGYATTGNVATLTPSQALPANTTCRATITTAVKDLAGNAMVNPFSWIFSTGATADTTPPTVSSTFPAPNATGVAFNAQITASFSEAMDPLTMTVANVQLSCPITSAPITGTVGYAVNGNVVTFTPASNLPANTLCRATLGTGVKDVAGNALASPFSWMFTTGVSPDTTAPTVVSTVPLANAIGVSTNSLISASFSEPMDPLSITVANFKLVCPASTPISGTVAYGVNGNVATFSPTSLLPERTTCTATITTGVKDVAGNPLATDLVWNFTTGSTPDTTPPQISLTNPADMATNVPVNSAISATFNEAMDPLTLTTARFTLRDGVNPVAGMVSYDVAARIATFTPTSALAFNTVYTANIANSATDVAGNGLGSGAVPNPWRFTTAASPVVTPVVVLGTVAPFGTFGGSAGMTNMGTLTQVNGDIGTTATTTASITGFHDTGGDIYTETPSNIGAVNGLIYTCTNSTLGPTSAGVNAPKCALATQARLDAQAAYLALAAKPAGANPGANLAGLTLAPGVYTAPGGSFLIQGGDLTLDAQGNPNASWVFQMATTLTVGGPGAAFPRNIILSGGAQAKNVFWQVGSAATINAGGGGTMVGTIIAQAGVTFSTAGNVSIGVLNGRALSLGASVTLVNTVINVPAP